MTDTAGTDPGAVNRLQYGGVRLMDSCAITSVSGQCRPRGKCQCFVSDYLVMMPVVLLLASCLGYAYAYLGPRIRFCVEPARERA